MGRRGKWKFKRRKQKRHFLCPFFVLFIMLIYYIYIGLLIHYLIMSGQVPVGSAQVLVEVPPHQIRVQSSRWPVSDSHVGLQDRINLVYASTWSCKMVTIVDSSPTPPLQGKPHRALVAGSSVYDADGKGHLAALQMPYFRLQCRHKSGCWGTASYRT